MIKFVHSETTRDILIEFYRQLKNKKIDLATALQTAQKNIIQISEYRHHTSGHHLF
jgi:CHAT domain-containing protein